MKDLLRYKLFDGLAASRFYPILVQVLTLVVFCLLIVGGLAAPHVSETLAGTLRNTNLSALIVWSLWWPLVIVSAVLFGRVWCQVCPMELVSSFFSKIGFKRKVPRFFVSGWGITFFYSLALLGFIRTFWAHRYPERMAVFFLFLFAAAMIIGLIFKKRAFCNYLCPVGRLLGLYGCCSILEWRARHPEICEGCRTKDCIAARHAYHLTARSCTSNLYPATIRDNRDCLVCTQCRKVCPYGNLRLSLRKPMADFFTSIKLSTAEFFLLFLAGGLVVWEISEEWDPAKQALQYLPNQVSAWMGASGEAAHLIHALFLFVGLPAVVFLLPVLPGKWLNKITLLESAKAFSLVFLPVMALTHMLKALFRITSRLPYYPLAFDDPVGYSTADMIASGEIVLDKQLPALLSPYLSWLALLIFIGALIAAWLIAYKSPAFKLYSFAGKIPYLAAITVYSAVFILTTILARF